MSETPSVPIAKFVHGIALAKLVDDWVDSMTEQRLSCCMFEMIVPRTGGHMLQVGIVGELLEARDFTVQSHSTVIIGTDPGTGVQMMSVTLFVRWNRPRQVFE